MYLAQAIEYLVQTGRARSISFEWLFPLTGFRAFESGIDCRILTIVAIDAALVFVTTRPAISVLEIRTAKFLPRVLLRASQLSSPAQKRVMSDVRAAMDFGFSCPRCRASHSSRMLCLKAARASAFGQSTIWFFLVKNRVQNCLARFVWLLNYVA